LACEQKEGAVCATQGVTDRLRRFIFEELHPGGTAELSNDDSLLEAGVLDSLGVFEVATFIENELGVTIADEDLVPDNFATIQRIANLVESKSTDVPRIP